VRLDPPPSRRDRGPIVEHYRCAEEWLKFSGGDVAQAVDNLRYERYVDPAGRWLEKPWAKGLYYGLRPFLPIPLRKHLQRVYLRGWRELTFPAWPVDRSADLLMERSLIAAMQAAQVERVPFIWFWPCAQTACLIVTHDVETKSGHDSIEALMDIDDAFGIKASIQVVPEKRYVVTPAYLEMIRSRGFEINVHGLDHDGNLFEDRSLFLESARKINEYAVRFGSRGFRSPSMYRNVDWLQDLNFSYDMSVPNVACLEPQQGGCCTVMPFTLPGGVTEIPLTTTQDYTLFHVLNDYSTTLWKEQMGLIAAGHGLMSFVVHPDYILTSRAKPVYTQLLEEFVRLQAESRVWVTLPGEVDNWWRQRSQMNLVAVEGGWRVEGPGSDRATVAYACLEGDRLVYRTDAKERLSHQTAEKACS